MQACHSDSRGIRFAIMPPSLQLPWRVVLLALVLGSTLDCHRSARASDPVPVSLWPGFRQGYAYSVAVQGNYAYVGLYSADVAVFDITRPTNVLAVGGC